MESKESVGFTLERLFLLKLLEEEELSSLASLSNPVFVPPRRERAEERGLVSRTAAGNRAKRRRA